MKLSELTGVKQYLKPDATVHDVLKEKGYSPVGRGMYATVYAHPQLPYVLKIFKVEDHAYLNFVKMVKKHNNDHFPKFRGLPMRIPNTEYYGIRMERLTEWEPNTREDKLENRLDKALVHISGLVDDLPDWRKISTLPDDQVTKKLLSDFFERWPQFLDALILLQEFERTTREVYFDLHSGNIMKRGSTPVITDPFSSGWD
jgi:hypothetical protein